ncbi:molybdate ABC transporter substrate-binding protein [Aquipuribacter hungaricus]|uniref:Molybdate ABC transporter substrate-binding protein n=2 Tax=Aquipuribacter hungaricus TaxID=545624 RepID=A0ABV7WBF9_9MICO
MRRRRTVRAAVLPACAAVVLAACGPAAPDGPGAGAAASAPAAGPASASSVPTVAPGEVVVLAAASLTEVMVELEERFEQAHPGTDVVLVLGPSSGLAQQVLAGSPGDLLVSAAAAPVQQLVDAGEVLGEPVDVAVNSPVLAVPAGNPGGVTGLADLAEDGLVVSLCEEQVPCGAVTAGLLEQAGVAARPDSLERDVRAVLTRLELGEADAGVVYATDVLASGGTVEVVDVPGAEQVVTAYPAVVLAGTTDEARARAFLALIEGPEGREVLAAAGFLLP